MSTVYDEVPYANLPFAQARPSVFATVAALHGLTPPDPRQRAGAGARVRRGREPGGHRGGRARMRPRSASTSRASAIAEARATATAAGLDNLRFEVGDVLALTDGELGEFDYVIAHGLYAWVGEPVREAALAACRSHLAPDGIAYVSYTAHPGGHLRQMLREAARVARARARRAASRAPSGRVELFALLDRIEESDGPSFYGGVLGRGAARARAPRRSRCSSTTCWAPSTSPCGSRTSRRRRRGTAWPTSPTRSPRRAGGRRGRRAIDAFVDDAAGEDRDRARAVLRPAGAAALPPLAAVPRRAAAVARGRPRCGAAAAGGRRRAGRARARAAARRAGRGAGAVREAARAARHAGRRARRDAGRGLRRGPGHLPRGPVAGRARAPASARCASALARSQARPGAIVTTLDNQLVRISDEPTAALLRLLDGTRDRAAIRSRPPVELTPAALDDALSKLAEPGCCSSSEAGAGCA